MRQTNTVTVIIPVYNEQKHIYTCLDSLIQQDFKPLQIIVVDDGSTDDTKAIVKQFSQVELLEQRHLGPGSARNLGSRHATGKVLVFVDADMKFDKTFISQLVKPVLDGKHVGTFSKHEYVANLDNPIAGAWSVVRGFEAGRMHPPDYPNQQPVFRAINKLHFDQVGGFDTTRGYDDDWSLSEKIGVLAVAVSEAKFFHYNPDSLKEVFTQSVWMATRRHKAGVLGKIYTLVKNNPVFSVIKSCVKSIEHKNAYVFVVNLVHELGLFWGAWLSITNGKTSK